MEWDVKRDVERVLGYEVGGDSEQVRGERVLDRVVGVN